MIIHLNLEWMWDSRKRRYLMRKLLLGGPGWGCKEDREMSKAQALSLDKQLESDCAALEESEAYVFHEEVTIALPN